jgi:uncharacterized surface protein with fasciclin (FAS1) repeats
MASIFGSNTIFSTFYKVAPAPCEKLGSTIRQEVQQCINDYTICETPECYSKSVLLLDYLDMYKNTPVTVFIFDNGAYDALYKDAIDSEKNKIARAHMVNGHILPDTIFNRINRITTLSRNHFFLDGINNNMFHLENNYPVVCSNIIKVAITKNVIIYFIDMPLFSLDKLYIDDSS